MLVAEISPNACDGEEFGEDAIFARIVVLVGVFEVYEIGDCVGIDSGRGTGVKFSMMDSGVVGSARRLLSWKGPVGA